MSKRPHNLEPMEANKHRRFNPITTSIDPIFPKNGTHFDSLIDIKDFIPRPESNNQMYGSNEEVVNAITKTMQKWETAYPFQKISLTKICDKITELEYFPCSSQSIRRLYTRCTSIQALSKKKKNLEKKHLPSPISPPFYSPIEAMENIQKSHQYAKKERRRTAGTKSYQQAQKASIKFKAEQTDFYIKNVIENVEIGKKRKFKNISKSELTKERIEVNKEEIRTRFFHQFYPGYNYLEDEDYCDSDIDGEESTSNETDFELGADDEPSIDSDHDDYSSDEAGIQDEDNSSEDEVSEIENDCDSDSDSDSDNDDIE